MTAVIMLLQEVDIVPASTYLLMAEPTHDDIIYLGGCYVYHATINITTLKRCEGDHKQAADISYQHNHQQLSINTHVVCCCGL